MSFATTFELEGPDRDVIAKQIIKAKGRRAVRNKVDLVTAITAVNIADTMKGSSTITVTLTDSDFELLDSGFFDPDEDGHLDPIEINYPNGSRFWWRVTQIAVSQDGVLNLTLMERTAVWLMSLKGPVKAKSRAKTTRAEFIYWLAGHVKAEGGIDFHSRELHRPQSLEKRDKKKKDEERRRNKSGGIHRKESLTIKGVKASPSQLNQVSRSLDVAAHLNAPKLAVIALLCAGIGESAFRAVVNDLGYGGVFQGQVETGGHFFNVDDTEEEAHYFLLGGKGYQGGGAIAMVRAGVKDPGAIANTVEGSGAGARFYNPGLTPGVDYSDEAHALLEAYGGGDFAGTPTRYKQYNFDVGTADNPHETFWAAMNRLAEEVNWALFVDGSDLYYDAETTLIQQKPVGIINRSDASVIDWNYDWDTRRIATEMTLELICEPFEFRAGEVLKLVGFGPASKGSTADLPGRWLISEIERDEESLASTFTLIQPTRPNPEPRPEIKQESGGDPSGPIEGTPKEIIDNIVLPIARECGVNRSVEENDAANATHGPTVSGGTSDHQGPPSVRWAADMSNGSSPTPEMDKLAKRLAKRFGIKFSMSGGIFEAHAKGYQFQLIYRCSDCGGDHTNHVHFGVHVE